MNLNFLTSKLFHQLRMSWEVFLLTEILKTLHSGVRCTSAIGSVAFYGCLIIKDIRIHMKLCMFVDNKLKFNTVNIIQQ